MKVDLENWQVKQLREYFGNNDKTQIAHWAYIVFDKAHKKQCDIHVVIATLPQDPMVLARYLHEAYEEIAKNNDWNTQENCKVDFSDLPIANKNTMILLAGKLILDFGGN
jgi:16S rRNA C1402 (ribose-2'-O) methylase RsmI